MKQLKAIVTEIERCSFEDGPGLRTVIFFKGCPLRCAWCHNPECIEPYPQTMFYPEKCIGCGMCEKGCFSGARVPCGKEMTDSEIFAQIMLDKVYYGEDGGVTFSGGEPMLQKEILKSLIEKCKEEGIGTAIETSLILFDENILSSVDYIMADFKIFDGEKHRQYTGTDNDKIKQHFMKLEQLNVPFLVRTPIIPGVNDSPEEIQSIRDFIKQFRNLQGYELFAYHPLGTSKQKALGLEIAEFEIPTNQKMEELRTYADLSGEIESAS